jgi:hypothetical protein
MPVGLELTFAAGLTFEGVEWLPLGLAVFSLFAGVAFALGGLASGASKRLAWTVVALVVLQAAGLLVLNRAQLSATVVNEFTLLIGNLAWCFLAFEMLGAFPVLGRVPGATVASRARAAATAANLLFCVVGIAVLATTGWLSELATQGRPSSTTVSRVSAARRSGRASPARFRRVRDRPCGALARARSTMDRNRPSPVLTPHAVPGPGSRCPRDKLISPYVDRDIGMPSGRSTPRLSR